MQKHNLQKNLSLFLALTGEAPNVTDEQKRLLDFFQQEDDKDRFVVYNDQNSYCLRMAR